MPFPCARPLAAVCLAAALGRASAVRIEAVTVEELMRHLVVNQSTQMQLQPGESEVIFIRHGWSLNNRFNRKMFKNAISVGKRFANDMLAYVGLDTGYKWSLGSHSEFKKGYVIACNEQKLCGDYLHSARLESGLDWELSRFSRDCLLHPQYGEQEALALGDLLKKSLPADFFTAIFVSPLRRTMQTALAALGSFMHDKNTAIMPWLHERYKSDSDLANDGTMNAAFLERYRNHLTDFGYEDHTASVDALKRGQYALGDGWVDKAGSLYPEMPQPTLPVAAPSNEEGYFYPRNGWNLYYESKEQLQERMVTVRRFLKSLPAGGRYVFVSHGGVGTALFDSGKLENLALVIGRFNPATADESSGSFFHSVTLARDEWQVNELKGWRPTK